MIYSKAKIGLVLAVLVALRCLWLWQPERQVRLHQRHMLDAAQERNWPKLSMFLDDGFRTSYGHDKTIALQQLHEVLKPFFALQIIDSEAELVMDKSNGRVVTLLRMNGKGLHLGGLVQSLVNQSTTPFVFTWKRGSWKPWDWRLVGADHPLIGLARARDAAL